MKKIILLSCILLLMPLSVIAATINVPGNQPNIQSGIDWAFDGDTVLIADGIYTGYGNLNINFNGKAITVKSENGPENCIIDCQQQGRGFWFYNGETETSVLEGLTIENGYVEGDGGGLYAINCSPAINNCVFNNNSADNDGGAAYSSSTFTNCTFINNSASSGEGGAAYSSPSSSSSAFTNCTFISNTAFSGGAVCTRSYSTFTDCTFTNNSAYGDGGAIYFYSHPDKIFTGCTFTGNSAYGDGGAVYYYKYGSSHPTTFTDCTFTNNSASSGDGGAVYSLYSSAFIDCTFSNNSASSGDGGAVYSSRHTYFLGCTFTGNSASSGGAVYFYSCSEPFYYTASNFTGCTFTGNSASGNGGAVYFHYASNGHYFSIFIDCKFASNNASGNGGAVYYYSYPEQDYMYPTFTDCTFTDNSASSGDGGAVYFFYDYWYSYLTSVFTGCTFIGNSASGKGGAVYSSHSSTTNSFTDCTFTNNSASSGGAVYSSQSSTTFTRCTFTCNSASSGGAVYFSSSSSSLTNCTFILNEATIHGGGLWCSLPFVASDPLKVKNCIFWGNEASEGAQVYEEGKPLFMTYSGIQGGHLGSRNINTDPLFIDIDNGDVRLQLNSPCIDTGTSDGAPSDDLDGNSRPRGAGFDMGAYEMRGAINVPGDQPTIQAGIDAAVDGDTVLIADGVYTGVGNYNVNFNGKAITVRSANGPENCIVDCQQLGQGFMLWNSETETSVLEGLTIKNGYSDSGGGGIYTFGSLPAIKNCVFKDNSASYGGAVYSSPSSISFTNCTFTGNSASSGDGGAVCSYHTSPSSPPSFSFTNCTFTGSSASDEGGAVFSYSPISCTNCTFTGNSASSGDGGGVSSSSSSFIDCTFTDNSASSGDGGACSSASSSFIDCTFTGNSASSGGAIDAPGFMGSFSCTNCTFTNNSASSGDGGAVNSFVTATNETFTDCIFASNSASSGDGGAVAFHSNAAHCSYINCIFTSNNASRGGASYSSYDSSNSSASSFTNCTFTLNVATSLGGAIWCNIPLTPEYSIITLKNCILWGNTAFTYPEIFEEEKPLVAICSNIQGGHIGENIINENPMFTDISNGDLHLLQNSPCIDTGTSEGAPVDDLDGFIRPIGGGCDMGVYEYHYDTLFWQGYSNIWNENQNWQPSMVPVVFNAVVLSDLPSEREWPVIDNLDSVAEKVLIESGTLTIDQGTLTIGGY